MNNENEFDGLIPPLSVEDLSAELEMKDYEIDDLEYISNKLIEVVDEYLSDRFYSLLANNLTNYELRILLHEQLKEIEFKIANNEL